MKHIMKLQAESFNRIKNGTKKIELRLFDEKRQLIKLGDIIEFQKEPDKDDTVETKVVALFNYPTFRDLINDFSIDNFGDENKEILTKNVYTFYSNEDEKVYSVLGIKVELINKQ